MTQTVIPTRSRLTKLLYVPQVSFWLFGLVFMMQSFIGKDKDLEQRQELSLRLGPGSVSASKEDQLDLAELLKRGLRFSILNKGNYPYGEIFTLIPSFFKDVSDPLCRSSSFYQGNEGRVILASSISTCQEFSQRAFTWLDRSRMVFVLLRSNTTKIHPYAKSFESMYEEVLRYSVPYNLGIFVIHPEDYDILARFSGTAETPFEVVIDLRIPSLGFSPNYREVALWIDPNNLYQYLTLVMLNQLSEQVSEDPAAKSMLTVRPFFNILRKLQPEETLPCLQENTSLADTEIAEMIAAQRVFCRVEFPEFCISRDKYGNSDDAILAAEFDEIIVQGSMFKLARKQFYRYVNQYAIQCIMEISSPSHLPACTGRLRKSFEEQTGLNIYKEYLSRDLSTQKSILESQTFGQTKFGTNPFRSDININGLMIKGQVNPQFLLRLICTGMEPQPASCSEENRQDIAKEVERLFLADTQYEYSNLSISLTLWLTLVFLIYMTGQFVLQAVYGDDTVPSFIPMAIRSTRED